MYLLGYTWQGKQRNIVSPHRKDFKCGDQLLFPHVLPLPGTENDQMTKDKTCLFPLWNLQRVAQREETVTTGSGVWN